MKTCGGQSSPRSHHIPSESFGIYTLPLYSDTEVGKLMNSLIRESKRCIARIGELHLCPTAIETLYPAEESIKRILLLHAAIVPRYTCDSTRYTFSSGSISAI